MKKSRAYVLLAALVVFICICTASLTEGRLPLKREALTLQNDNLRAMRIELTAEEIAQYADECNLPVGEYLCTLMAAENWTADVQTAQSLTHKQAVALRNRLVRHYPEEFYKMSSLYAGLVADMQCFPIPVSKGNEQMWVESVIHGDWSVPMAENAGMKERILWHRTIRRAFIRCFLLRQGQ